MSWGLVLVARATSRSRSRALHARSGTALPPAQPCPGLAADPVEEILSPKHALACTQRRDRSSNNLRLGSSVKSKLHFQNCIRASELHEPSPFTQRNLGALMQKTKPTECSFPFRSAIAYPDACAQNGMEAHWHTATCVHAAVLQSRVATSKLPWGSVPGPANSQAVCSGWRGTDSLTAQWSCGA